MIIRNKLSPHENLLLFELIHNWWLRTIKNEANTFLFDKSPTKGDSVEDRAIAGSNQWYQYPRVSVHAAVNDRIERSICNSARSASASLLPDDPHRGTPFLSAVRIKGSRPFLSRCGVKTSWVDLERTPRHGTMTDYPRWPPCAIVLCCDHRDQILLRISMRRTVISDPRRSMSRIAFFFFFSFFLSFFLSSWLRDAWMQILIVVFDVDMRLLD